MVNSWVTPCTKVWSLESDLLIDIVSAAASLEPVKSIDDFAPDEGLDASFLDDTKDAKGFGSPAKRMEDETSDR